MDIEVVGAPVQGIRSKIHIKDEEVTITLKGVETNMSIKDFNFLCLVMNEACEALLDELDGPAFPPHTQN